MGQFEDCLIDCEASMSIHWEEQTRTLYEDVLNLMKSDIKCPYKTLGVSKSASMQEIKAAYQNLTLKYHPSQNRNATEEDRMKIEWKFEEIAKAYVKLSQSKMPRKQESLPPQPSSSRQTFDRLTADQIQRMENELKKMKAAKKGKREAKSKEECAVM
jgi:preprotein translocase subunit Sec63